MIMHLLEHCKLTLGEARYTWAHNLFLANENERLGHRMGGTRI